MPPTRPQIVALLFEGIKARDGLPTASASALAETVLQDYERSRICPMCGSSINHRHDSRHLLPDPVSIRETDH